MLHPFAAHAILAFVMNYFEFASLVWAGSFAAGIIGALTGLGGGVVIVPMLTLLFHVNVRYAIGASLVSVIATSSGAAAAYVREGYSNIRMGMFLEIATTLGALTGANLAHVTQTNIIAVIFGAVLVYSAIDMFRPGRKGRTAARGEDRLARLLKLNGSFPSAGGKASYEVRNVPQGFGVMYAAGVLSGLLGIGSGAAKVLAMDRVMGVPLKVSTTTSNFMIGVTAAASAGLYLRRGYILPDIALPVTLGVLPGSLLGARLLTRARTGPIRTLFGAVILAVALEMIFNGVSGRI
jgi:uncharacterized membrane protein YfcA